MIIEGWIITLSIFILGLVWKVAASHFTLASLKKGDNINKIRLSEVEINQLKISEALDRTYVTRDSLHEMCVTRAEHATAIRSLDEKLVSEMRHINKKLDEIGRIIEDALRR